MTAFYIGGSVGLVAVFMLAESLQLLRRHRAALANRNTP